MTELFICFIPLISSIVINIPLGIITYQCNKKSNCPSYEGYALMIVFHVIGTLVSSVLLYEFVSGKNIF